MQDETPGDRLNKDLRDRLEKARKSMSHKPEPTEPSSPTPKPFDEHWTMFKLEERERTTMSYDPDGRKMVCVNCGKKVHLDIYLEFQERMESECPTCKMTSQQFYGGK